MKSSIGRKALLAALLAAVGAPVAPAAPVVSQAPAGQQGADKQLPPRVSRHEATLAFLRGFGAHRYTASGCPWPGRRAACARRRAGTTRRMR